MTIAIVGGGLAGARVAEAYREAGGADAIVLLSADAAPPCHRPPLSKRFLRGEVEAEDCHVHPPAWYADNGIDLRLETRVERVDAGVRELELDGGERVAWERLVVASGSRPRPLGDALTLRTLADATRIRERARAASRAAVIGTGFIGMETAASLTQLGVQVTVYSHDDLYGQFRTPPLSRTLERVYRDRGVELRLGEPVEDVSALDADLVLAGIGVVPNDEFLDGSGVDVDDGVLVNERYEASAPGVYAAGDVARFHDPVSGMRRRIEHWSNANYQGAQLGRILAGADEGYDQVASFFTEVFGITIRVHGALEVADELVVAEQGDERLLALHGRDGALVAAVTVGLDDEEQEDVKRRIREREPLRR